jgi:hypothetical protein
MNPEAPDPLASLRAYHDPGAVSWWPPAPGWWLLALVAVLVLLGLILWLRRRWRARATIRVARRELTELRARLRRDGDQAGFLRALNLLLRRFALTRFPRAEVAALSGDDWLRFLDARGGGGAFTQGVGRVLGDGPYRRATAYDAEALIGLAARWLRKQRSPHA